MPWSSDEIESEILAIHAALVPNGPQGEVVLFGGDEHWASQQESAANGSWKKTRVYDVATHSLVPGQVQSPDSDVFCAHHVFVGDGRLLIAGGTSEWPTGADGHHHNLDFLGHSRCWLYNPRQRLWVETGRLNRNPDQLDEARSGGRWYPGLVALADGSTVAFYGHLDRNDFRHRNILPERYFLSRGGWTNLPNPLGNYGEPGEDGRRYLFFMRGYVLPSGKIFSATPMPTGFDTTPDGSDGAHFSTALDVDAGVFSTPRAASPDGVDGDWSYPAVLLPLLPHEGAYNARILYWNGATPRVIDTDAASPDWQNTGPRDPAVAARARTNGNMVMLPTGQACAVGGASPVSPEQGVNQVELFTPDIDWTTNAYGAGGGTWSLEAGAGAHTRNYHSTALLLPNGKVWVAGGSINADSGNPAIVGQRNIELYEPPYIAVANRINIEATPIVLGYGEAFEARIDRAATNIGRVALIRAGSVTHATDNDQRYVGLRIVSRSGNTVRLTAPPNGNVAPPGYYMLWVIDTDGRPCQLARFVRVAHLSCRLIADRSTFSQEEVQALGGGADAVFSAALYVDFDGFRAAEISGVPDWTLEWGDGGTVDPAQVRLEPAGRYNEVEPPDPDLTQRTTFAFNLVFGSMDAFNGWIDQRDIRVRFRLGARQCQGMVRLTKSPNPYMIDIDPVTHANPAWLSTDVRVFKVRPNQTRYGATLSLAGDGPWTYIRQVLDNLRSGGASFGALPTDGAEAVLDGAYMSGVPLLPTFNFAVARVRYRATATTATDVRCFFRMCNAAATGLEFDTNAVYRTTGGADPKPLLGVAGGQVVSIPFFNARRQPTVAGEAGAIAMGDQLLHADYDIQDIAPTGGEAFAYFGCYLDINTPGARFPVAPVGDGPFPAATALPIRDLLRSWHNCIVAEIVFGGDPTVPGAGPSDSDNLAQRNLAIIGLENPGQTASRVAMHTFELAPSDLSRKTPLFDPTDPKMTGPKAVAQGRYNFPDELFFDWRSLPPDAKVSLYFSDVSTADIVALLKCRLSAPVFEVLDDRTLRFRVGDCAWLPLPGDREVRIPALISIELPPGIVEGQVYRVTVRQISGRTSTVVGAVTIEMPVTKAEALRPEAERQLSYMGHLLTTLPAEDRWRPLIVRLVQHLAARVDAVGGKWRDVAPNPDGSGLAYRPKDWRPGDAFPEDGFGSGRRDDDCPGVPAVPDKTDVRTACCCSPWWVVLGAVLGAALLAIGVKLGKG